MAFSGFPVPFPTGLGGTGTSTTFTQGSVVFAGASGVYAQDNTKFFWDNTNKYLGIGGIPTTQLDIINSTVGSNANFRVRGNNQGITAGQVFMDVFSGDSGHGFYGYGVASMLFGTNGTTKMTIDSTGNVGVGKTPSYLLDVNGTANANLFQTFLVSIGWTDTFDSNLSTPKNFFNFGSDWHGSSVLSSNVYLQNDALKIANSHATISGSVLKIPGNGKTNQGAFVFYTAPPAAVTAAAAYAGIQRMVIQTDGNITMGTAVSKNRLQLDGANASFGICFDVNNSSAMGHNLYYSGGWKRLYAGTDTSLVNYADGSTPNADISFYQVVTGAAAANSAISFGVPTLYLKSSNKYVGINTTAPTSALHIVASTGYNGSIALTGGTTSGQGNIQMGATASSSWDSNVLYADSNARTMGMVCSVSPAFVAANGPYVAMRGITYTAVASQRGNLMLSAGNPTTPGAAEGSIAFRTGADVIRYFLHNDGRVGIGNVTDPASLMANTTTNQTDYVGYGVQIAAGFTWSFGGAGYGMAFTQTASGTARNGFLVNTASTAIDSAALTVGSTAVDKGLFVVRSDGNIGIQVTDDNYTDIHSNFTMKTGSFALAYIAKTANYTLDATNSTVDCTANTFDLTLPTAVGIPGRIYHLKNTGSGIITIKTTSAQTIDGIASGVLTLVTNDVLVVQSTNTNWIIIN
jgi:hypothetical protein